MSIQMLSPDEFRQQLAGLVDHSFLPQEAEEEMKNAAVEMCCILAKVYSDDLDRKNLWERIGNGLKVCTEKCNGDWETMLNQLLDYVGADSGAVAANPKMQFFVEALGLKSAEWQQGFIRIVGAKHFIIIVRARQAWKEGV